ncbi:hypothetical protein IMG5_130840 [Ichthyophthirius multifiliis]|uniref:DJ-1/PfpI domain-containing protein n=1 Tax=Ichthyophthirius multifiliis TaxID=5932 RepID=G0QWC0_ICHMU|nr:hypothetical protein IMG5_130840 [Ichthyophthirius multifiliis]EGR30492.1 hypothetical protein IMG5_130840 [Ichthyophthirius multifiliis]|eukprot:XP_004032079.1 hypothetical protein IMG5_130840 [Ichthyophthirius multifiliis]
MTKNILIITGDFVEDYEIMVPFQTLEFLGYNVHIVCPEKDEGALLKTAIHDFEGDQTYTEKPGHHFKLNYSIKNVKPETYHGLVLPGGRAPEYLRLHETVLTITKHFVDSKKPILSICHGIQILTAIPDAIRGYNIAAYYACEPEVKLAGANFLKLDANKAILHNNIVSTPAWPGHQDSIRKFSELLGTTITHK